MANRLQQYFPMIHTKEYIIEKIETDRLLKTMYEQWEEKHRQEFLDFCTGVRGVKPMYDFISKEILNPETVPERIDELLSLLLKQEVHIVEVLPGDNTRIADESSLVIMDIVVQLMDGSIANLEIQKIGYRFPGERSACYSADLLLRQYKRIRSARKKKFIYKDIKQVYTIVLFEQSPAEFHQFPDTYLHYFRQESNTGLEFNLLQKYLFIPLDIFREIQHNKNIRIENRLDAWLAFLCMDEPEAVIAVMEKYPDFKEIYGQIYSICQNIEEVMGMFSEELRKLDRNTVQLMIDEMQEELEQERLKAEQERLIAEQERLKAAQKEQQLILELEQQKQELEGTKQAYQKALERIGKLETSS